MSRRRSLLVASLAWLATFLGPLALSAACASPNVLFIVADDLNCAIGPYGDPVAVTPHLDRLAARGLVFERTYCQQAVCNPSRASFLTGLRPDKVGVDDLRKSFRNTAPNGDRLVTLPQHFKNHGYFCRNIGKMFHNMGETQDRRSWSVDEVLFKGPHSADTVFANAPLAPGEKKPRFKAPATEAHAVPDTTYRDGQIASLAAAMLRSRTADSPPFFLAVGFWRPHLPFVAPKRYWDLYNPEAIPLPEPASPPADVPAIALHPSREIRGYGHVPRDRNFNVDEVRLYRHGYYASISFLDAQFGKLLDALRESDLADETIVVFTSDHGFHVGEHALWGKTSNFELDARVPLIVAAPDRRAGHGRQTKALVELIDLYPTLAHLAGIADDLPRNLDGVSLLPVLTNPDATVKEAAFTRHQHPFYGGRKNWRAWGDSMRTDRWRYTEWRAIADGRLIARELYDHLRDPRETHNVATVADYREIVQVLAERLAESIPGSRQQEPSSP